MIPTVKILQGDWVEQMASLPPDAIDLTVTSPPYDDARTYGGHSWDFQSGALELFRITKPGGVVCWNVNDMVKDGCESLTSCKQKIFFVEKCGFRIHDTMIYRKSNFSHPEKSRYHQVFEYVFVLSKGNPKTFNPIKDKPNSTAGCVGNLGVNTFTERDGSKSVRSKKITAEFGMRHNVWEGKTRGQEDMCEVLKHPAMMPKWLVSDLILSFSNPHDVVLDPMAGSGTVPQQALTSHRNAIAIEINPQYVSLIKQSCNITIPLPML